MDAYSDVLIATGGSVIVVMVVRWILSGDRSSLIAGIGWILSVWFRLLVIGALVGGVVMIFVVASDVAGAMSTRHHERMESDIYLPPHSHLGVVAQM